MKTKISILILLSIITAAAQQDFNKYFNSCNVKGSITIFDYKNSSWTFSDSIDAKERTTPASTFKIPNSLIAIETGAVKDENEIIKWDGIKRSAQWDKDTDLKNAYKNSTVWFYQELARRVGIENYNKYLAEMNYGNREISKVDNFWLDETIKISPIEQINFLRNLYEENFALSKRTYSIVKEVMVDERNDKFVIRAKTGWGHKNADNLWVGWWIGWIETKGNTYFFATRIYKPKDQETGNFMECRKEITRKIFKELNIL